MSLALCARFRRVGNGQRANHHYTFGIIAGKSRYNRVCSHATAGSFGKIPADLPCVRIVRVRKSLSRWLEVVQTLSCELSWSYRTLPTNPTNGLIPDLG